MLLYLPLVARNCGQNRPVTKKEPGGFCSHILFLGDMEKPFGIDIIRTGRVVRVFRFVKGEVNVPVGTPLTKLHTLTFW